MLLRNALLRIRARLLGMGRRLLRGHPRLLWIGYRLLRVGDRLLWLLWLLIITGLLGRVLRLLIRGV